MTSLEPTPGTSTDNFTKKMAYAGEITGTGPCQGEQTVIPGFGQSALEHKLLETCGCEEDEQGIEHFGGPSDPAGSPTGPSSSPLGSPTSGAPQGPGPAAGGDAGPGSPAGAPPTPPAPDDVGDPHHPWAWWAAQPFVEDLLEDLEEDKEEPVRIWNPPSTPEGDIRRLREYIDACYDTPRPPPPRRMGCGVCHGGGGWVNIAAGEGLGQGPDVPFQQRAMIDCLVGPYEPDIVARFSDLGEWIAGTGGGVGDAGTVYGPGSNESASMRASGIFSEFEDRFRALFQGKSCEEWHDYAETLVSFKPFRRHFWADGFSVNTTAHFVGSAAIDAFVVSRDADSGRVCVVYVITNTTSIQSAAYHIPGTRTLNHEGGPMGNWVQYYVFSDTYCCDASSPSTQPK